MSFSWKLLWLYRLPWVASNKKRRHTRSPWRPRVETLEDRLAPAVFVVTTGADNGNDANPIRGSLREAIKMVNLFQQFDAITFSLPANVQGQVVVQGTSLPALEKAARIDGTTAGRGGVTITADKANPPMAPAGRTADGLALIRTNASSASGSKLLGLTISGFRGSGILLNNVSDVQIGVGTGANGGGVAGVTVTNNAFQLKSAGIMITGKQATFNSVIGSYIGTDANSTQGIGNANPGVSIA